MLFTRTKLHSQYSIICEQNIKTFSVKLLKLILRTQSNFISTFNSNLTAERYDKNEKFSIITHGRTESIKSSYVANLISNLLFYRGGCVIFMDYSNFSTSSYNRLSMTFNLYQCPLQQVKAIGKGWNKLWQFIHIWIQFWCTIGCWCKY